MRDPQAAARAAMAGKLAAEALTAAGNDAKAGLLKDLLAFGICRFEVTVIGDGGEPYGTVAYRDGAAMVKVTDEQAFLRWVEDRFPTEVISVPVVRPAFQSKILSEVKARGAAVDGDGQTIPGVEFTRADPTIVVTPTAQARDLARAALNGQGRPALPGLAVDPDTPTDGAT